MRPIDLARGHGLSTQAVRNYEARGVLPTASRTRSGYRAYDERHALALRAFLTMVPAYGHAVATRVLRAVNDDQLEDALAQIDDAHLLLARDRATLRTVRDAAGHLAQETGASSSAAVYSVGELARRLGVTPATLRNWERAGILSPARGQVSGRRTYGPDDVRDAELAHLLRRGGYLLGQIAIVVRQVREAGGSSELVAALDGWQQRITDRGTAMLRASGLLAEYLDLRGSETRQPAGSLPQHPADEAHRPNPR